MLKVEQYDTVLLKDGRQGAVVEKFSENTFLVDVGTSEKDWDTVDVKMEEIDKIL